MLIVFEAVARAARAMAASGDDGTNVDEVVPVVHPILAICMGWTTFAIIENKWRCGPGWCNRKTVVYEGRKDIGRRPQPGNKRPRLFVFYTYSIRRYIGIGWRRMLGNNSRNGLVCKQSLQMNEGSA